MYMYLDSKLVTATMHGCYYNVLYKLKLFYVCSKIFVTHYCMFQTYSQCIWWCSVC